MIKAFLFAVLFIVVGAIAFALLAPLISPRGTDYRKAGRNRISDHHSHVRWLRFRIWLASQKETVSRLQEAPPTI